MSETFKYLGLCGSVHYFFHELADKKRYDDDMTMQLHNVLIHHGMVTENNQSTVVFSLVDEKNVDVTIIDHMIPRLVGSPPEALQKALHHLMKNDMAATFITKYVYSAGRFEGYWVEDFFPGISDPSYMIVRNVRNSITVKPLPDPASSTSV